MALTLAASGLSTVLLSGLYLTASNKPQQVAPKKSAVQNLAVKPKIQPGTAVHVSSLAEGIKEQARSASVLDILNAKVVSILSEVQALSPYVPIPKIKATTNDAIGDLNASISALGTVIGNTVTSYSALVSTNASQAFQITGLQSDLSAANASNESLTTQVGNLQTSNAQKDATIASLNTDIQTLTDANATLTASAASLQTQLNTANATIASQTSQISDLNNQVSSLTAQVDQLNTDIAAAQAQIDALTAQLNALQNP